MILARKLHSAVRLYRNGGLSLVAEFAWNQSRGYLAANAIVPRGAGQRAGLLSRVFNASANYNVVDFDAADARACRASLLLPYLRRQFHDVCELRLDSATLQPAEMLIYADSLLRRWEFRRLDHLLPHWRPRVAGTKFAVPFEQLGRRVALRLGRLTEAGEGLAQAAGEVAEWRLRAEILDAQGRMAEARQAFRQAAHRRPDDAEVRLGFAFHLLKAGQILDGLEQWSLADYLMGTYPLRRRRRQWAGESLEGRTLLVIFEHGLGDMIQLSRFLRPLREAHPRARIIGSVPDPLIGLLARSFPDVDFVSSAADEPAYDVYVPSVQLPLVLEATSLEPTSRYLLIAGHAAEAGQPAVTRRRVGVCWRGFPRQYELTRSIPLATFARLFDASDVDFVVLLNQLTPDEEGFLAPFGNVLRPPIADFVDLGSLVAGCDLVISVDTAVAHVAGAGGKRALLLSRPDSCWRWGQEGARGPWYSTVDVLRHPGDLDWDVVLAEAETRLRAELGLMRGT